MTINKPKSNNAVGYVRVSTVDQAQEGVSLDAQRAKIKSYCELHGLELLAIHADEGVSGKRADNRPGLQAALADACASKCVLVCYSMSRMSRTTRDCLDIAERINKAGANLASITENIDTTSAMGECYFSICAVFSQLERRMIGERTLAAMAYMRKHGRKISRNVYGYEASENGLLTLNHAEQEVIAKILLFAKRTCKPLGCAAIATQLNKSGIKPKYGARWYASSVRSVIRSDERRRPVLAVA